jgi:transposase
MIWIGIDAHKRVHQAVALSADGVYAHKVIANTAMGWADLVQWASGWPERVWAVEGSGSLGRGLAQFLVGRGEHVREVNPRWTAQRRRTQRRFGKSDRLDAQAIARLLREEGESLPLVQADELAVASLQLWSRLRQDLVDDMTRLRNRLHALLLLCDPEYRRAIRSLRSQRGVQAARTYTAPGSGPLARVREQAVRQLAEQLALLVRQERELRAKLEALVRQQFGPLLAIAGVRPIIAAGLVAELGQPRPGFGVPQLAAVAGVAPIEASSAGGIRHRLSRRGNRRLNMLLYLIALAQERAYAPAQAYMARRQQEGRTAREARRALKRHLVRRIWHQWQACWAATGADAVGRSPTGLLPAAMPFQGWGGTT